MKTLNLTFEDKEFKELKKIKDSSGQSWERFIIEIAEVYKNGRKYDVV